MNLTSPHEQLPRSTTGDAEGVGYEVGSIMDRSRTVERLRKGTQRIDRNRVRMVRGYDLINDAP